MGCSRRKIAYHRDRQSSRGHGVRIPTWQHSLAGETKRTTLTANVGNPNPPRSRTHSNVATGKAFCPNPRDHGDLRISDNFARPLLVGWRKPEVFQPRPKALHSGRRDCETRRQTGFDIQRMEMIKEMLSFGARACGCFTFLFRSTSFTNTRMK